MSAVTDDDALVRCPTCDRETCIGDCDRLPPLLDDVSILAQPDLTFAVAGLVPAGSAGMIVGASGTCKSGLALHLAVALAHGSPLFGAAVDATARGPILWVMTEGATAGLKQRIIATKHAYGLPLDVRLGLYIERQPMDLLSERSVTYLHARMAQLGARGLVIDTLTGALPGHDQNAERVMGGAATGLCRLAEQHRAVVVCIHHTRQDEQKERGSTALRAGLDWAWSVTRAEDVVSVSCLKMREAAEFPTFAVRVVTDPSLPSYGLHTATDAAIVTAPLSAKAIQLLDALHAKLNDQPTTVKDLVAASAVSERQVYNVLPVLAARGLVRRVGAKWQAVARPAIDRIANRS